MVGDTKDTRTISAQKVVESQENASIFSRNSTNWHAINATYDFTKISTNITDFIKDLLELFDGKHKYNNIPNTKLNPDGP